MLKAEAYEDFLDAHSRRIHKQEAGEDYPAVPIGR